MRLVAGLTPLPIESQAVPSGGRPVLHVDSLGARAPAIVFLAGLGATSSYWKARVGPLADDYQLFLPDPLGFGRSPRPDTAYSVELHAESLETLVEREAPVIMVGHSFGALVAAAYARAHPEQVRGLVLIGTPVFASKAEAVGQLSGGNLVKRWVLSHRKPTALFCALTRKVARPFIPLLAPDMPNDVRDDATAHTSRASTSSLHDGLYALDGRELLRSIPDAVPVLVIHGERDRTAPWLAVQQVLESRRAWEYLLLPEADHHPVLRSPSAVLRAIREFADGLQAQPPPPTEGSAARLDDEPRFGVLSANATKHTQRGK
ncbi:MAG: alpha/beta hydrolase [Gemmatimonadetes bacterium]|nr:alpha/beta hydrolase [Gemmatimonadota bacterium]